jgi:hypothetical protein
VLAADGIEVPIVAEIQHVAVTASA